MGWAKCWAIFFANSSGHPEQGLGTPRFLQLLTDEGAAVSRPSRRFFLLLLASSDPNSLGNLRRPLLKGRTNTLLAITELHNSQLGCEIVFAAGAVSYVFKVHHFCAIIPFSSWRGLGLFFGIYFKVMHRTLKEFY
jgi:hypothetical protein